jgi:hypothetical protein
MVRSHDDLDRAMEALLTGANNDGGIDNISVTLAWIEPQ